MNCKVKPGETLKAFAYAKEQYFVVTFVRLAALAFIYSFRTVNASLAFLQDFRATERGFFSLTHEFSLMPGTTLTATRKSAKTPIRARRLQNPLADIGITLSGDSHRSALRKIKAPQSFQTCLMNIKPAIDLICKGVQATDRGTPVNAPVINPRHRAFASPHGSLARHNETAGEIDQRTLAP